MLINKKFLALALLPLFAACVVTDGDDDDGAGTDTDPSTTASTTASTTDSTTASTTASTTDSTTASTTDSTTMTTSESDTDTADTGTESDSETDTDTGGDAGYCAAGCVEAIDCCAGEPTCEGGLGTYPYDWSCEEGACAAGGCTDDEQCTFGGALPTWVCADFGEGFFGCAAGCAADADCQGVGTEDYTCTGPDSTCEAPACTADADCQGPGTEDATCDVATGDCNFPGCLGDKECAEGQVCVLP